MKGKAFITGPTGKEVGPTPTRTLQRTICECQGKRKQHPLLTVRDFADCLPFEKGLGIASFHRDTVACQCKIRICD